MNPIENAIWTIGYNGPIIAFFLAIWKLWYLRPDFYWFIIGFAGNEMVNEFLKMWIKEPRPKDLVKFIDHNNLKGAHEYGMPSGHAQEISFIIVFVYAVFRHIEWLYMTIPLWILTCFQRWTMRRHTVKQLVTGSIVGGTLGAFTYWIMRSLHLFTNLI